MNAVNFTAANVTLTAPKGWDAEKDGICYDLPVFRTDGGEYLTLWRPSEEELKALNEGKPVMVSLVGGVPPMDVRVCQADIDEIPLVYRMNGERIDN